MCQKCFDFAVSLFGKMNDDQVNDLFWNATSFPAGSHEQVKQQLQKHYDNGARTPEDAVSLAHEQQIAP